MTLVVGVGQAGCNIAAEMARAPNARDLLDIYLVNSTVRDLVPIKDVPPKRWVGVNERDGFLPLADVKHREEKVAGGMGKDPRRCYNALTSVFDQGVANLEKLPTDYSSTRFAVVIFSGGGGTGAGAGPVFARALQELTRDADGESPCKVLGVMVLPSTGRTEELASGTMRETWNTWFSFQRALEVFDGMVLVDNERLRHVGDIERAFPRFNKYVARCLSDMVLGNLTELELPSNDQIILQQTDVRDLVTAGSLSQPGGERKPGVMTIGRGVEMLRNPAGYLMPLLPVRRPDLVNLTLLAQERMTLDVPPDQHGEKAYLLVRGPQRVLVSAEGGEEVSEAISIVAGRTRRGEVHYGTALTKRPLASVTLGITYDPAEVGRLVDIEGEATQYEWTVEADVPA